MRITLFPLLLIAMSGLYGAEFKSPKECVVGNKVTDRENKTGTVVSVESTLCRVKLDAGGAPTVYPYWMLHPAGGSAETDDKLVDGKYNCWVGSQAAGELTITGKTYQSEGKKGTFRVEPSRRIVFESGPFSTYHAKLLSGPKIGMNLNGGTFYNLVCETAR